MTISPKKAVIFDLDDTLYDELDYVHSGFHAVDNILSKHGVMDGFSQLNALFETSPAGVLDRFLMNNPSLESLPGFRDELLFAFRFHQPQLELNPKIKSLLIDLAAYPVGIVTDGDASRQKAKVKALGLETLVNYVVYTDYLGRQHWKPSPKPFDLLCDKLRILSETQVLFVGDNPKKDFIEPRRRGWQTLRLRKDSCRHRSNCSNFHRNRR